MITLHPVVSQNYRAVSAGTDVLSCLAHTLKGHRAFQSLRSQLQYYVHAPFDLLSYTSSSLGIPIVVLSGRGKRRSSKGGKRSHKIHTYFPELLTCRKHILYSFMPPTAARMNPIILYYDNGIFCALSRVMGKCGKRSPLPKECRRFPFRSPFMRSKQLKENEELPCALQILSA